MNSTPPPASGNANRPSIILPVAIVGLLIIGGAIAYKRFQPAPAAPAPTEAPVTTSPVAESHPAIRAIVPRAENSEPAAPVATVSGPGAAAASAPATPVQPTVDTRQLITSLTSLNIQGPISAEDAQKWKDSLRQLIAQGPAGVAAIREYLAQNIEVNYAGVEGADQLGYSSLRSALLSALGQIGGADATTAMLQTMQSTTFPADIATIASVLEQQAPGQYQDQILAAVRSELAQGALDQLPNANVGPLFKLLTDAAAKGVDVSADLAQYDSKWPYYSAIALGDMQNDQGLPTLTQMMQNGSGASQTAAAEALAQMAGTDPKALDALMNSIGQLPDNVLAQLAPYLAGRQNELDSSGNPSGTPTQGVHMANGNQDYTAADTLDQMTQTQLQNELDALNKVLNAIPSNDIQAQIALDKQKSLIESHIKH